MRRQYGNPDPHPCFFIVTSNFKKMMYPQSFLCEKAKIKQRTPSKKRLCEIGGKAIWESRFTSFFFSFQFHLHITLDNKLPCTIILLHSFFQRQSLIQFALQNRYSKFSHNLREYTWHEIFFFANAYYRNIRQKNSQNLILDFKLSYAIQCNSRACA